MSDTLPASFVPFVMSVTGGVWFHCVRGDHDCGPGAKMYVVGDGLVCDQHVRWYWAWQHPDGSWDWRAADET